MLSNFGGLQRYFDFSALVSKAVFPKYIYYFMILHRGEIIYLKICHNLFDILVDQEYDRDKIKTVDLVKIINIVSFTQSKLFKLINY